MASMISGIETDHQRNNPSTAQKVEGLFQNLARVRITHELIRPQLARRRTVEITRERRKHDGQGNTLTLTHLFQRSNRWDQSSDNRR